MCRIVAHRLLCLGNDGLGDRALVQGIGTAIGLLAGLYFGYLSVQAFANLGFPADYLFPWSGIVIALAVGLIFGALSAVLPARQAARMDVVEALRYE